jgi:hypothetical protein
MSTMPPLNEESNNNGADYYASGCKELAKETPLTLNRLEPVSGVNLRVSGNESENVFYVVSGTCLRRNLAASQGLSGRYLLCCTNHIAFSSFFSFITTRDASLQQTLLFL